MCSLIQLKSPSQWSGGGCNHQTKTGSKQSNIGDHLSPSQMSPCLWFLGRTSKEERCWVWERANSELYINTESILSSSLGSCVSTICSLLQCSSLQSTIWCCKNLCIHWATLGLQILIGASDNEHGVIKSWCGPLWSSPMNCDSDPNNTTMLPSSNKFYQGDCPTSMSGAISHLPR